MKIPSPSLPDAPKYWMDETVGELAPAIHSYINGETMTLRQLSLMRAYLRQWINSPVWDMNPNAPEEWRNELKEMRANVQTMVTQADLDSCVMAMTAVGMDPL